MITVVKILIFNNFQTITHEKNLEKVPMGQLGCRKHVYIPVVYSGCIWDLLEIVIYFIQVFVSLRILYS